MADLKYFKKSYLNRMRQDRDRVNFYFGVDYPPVIEAGHRSVSFLVNVGASNIMKECAKPLGRARQRAVKSRLEFLSVASVSCLPLVDRSAVLALPLFYEFTKKYTLKSDFRNSLNDILILALSQYYSLPMKTRDKVLADFSQEALGSSVEDDGVCLKISPTRRGRGSRGSFESKGYVNKGWRVYKA